MVVLAAAAGLAAMAVHARAGAQTTAAAVPVAYGPKVTVAQAGTVPKLVEGQSTTLTLRLSRAIGAHQTATFRLAFTGAGIGDDFTLALDPKTNPGVAVDNRRHLGTATPQITLTGTQQAALKLTALKDNVAEGTERLTITVAEAYYDDGVATWIPRQADPLSLDIVDGPTTGDPPRQPPTTTTTTTTPTTTTPQPTGGTPPPSGGTPSGTPPPSGGTPSGTPPPSTGAAPAFSDLGDSHRAHRAALASLAEDGTLDGLGCGGGKLCPTGAIGRWEMAVALIRVLDGKDPASVRSSRFADVDAGDWWAAHTERLAQLGVTVGCATGPRRYCPDQPVTRAQMASFLKRAFNLPAAAPAGFTDIAGSVHEADIDALHAAAITRGCTASPLRYCPHTAVTRAQMASFLTRAIAHRDK